jgi:hypothetical protein
MSLDLDAVKAAIDATTPGPWEARTEIDGWRAGRDTVVWAHDKRVLTVGQTRPHHDHEAEANAAFTAAARTLVPSLLAEVERLREALERRARNEARLANVLDEVREYAQHQDDAGDAPWVGTDLRGILDEAATS